MKLLFSTLIVLVAAALFALFAHDDPGYIIINYRQWRIETSLIFMVTAVLLAFLVLYYLVRFIVNIRLMPRRLREWRQRRQQLKARHAFSHGLIELAEGHWKAAEKYLLKHIDSSEAPALNYLNAARAAQHQGALDRRDYYLRMANESPPRTDLGVALTQAELQLTQGQMEQALATLSSLHHNVPDHAHVQKLLLGLYARFHGWEQLLELLPKLGRKHAIGHDDIEHLELAAYTGLLKNVAGKDNIRHLNDAWQRIPKHLKHHEPLLSLYIHELIRHGANSEAESLLYQSLNRKWDDSLAYLYGIIESSDPSTQLNRAEAWLSGHESNPTLLLTLGRLCVRNKLWGKAHNYLNASAGLDARPETYKELGGLLERLGKPQEATQYYRKGLNMISNVVNQPSPTVNNIAPDQGLPSLI